MAGYKSTLLFCVFLSANSHALDIEIGQSKYIKIGDGVWYQEPFEHDLDMKSLAFGIYLRRPIAHWIDWRIGYFDLGTVKTDAMATPEDANYDFNSHQCKDPCLPLSRFKGTGGIKGISVTTLPTYRSGNFSAFLELGITYYHTSWDVSITHSPEYISGTSEWICDMCAVDKWNTGYRYGVGIGYQDISISYSVFDNLDTRGIDTNNGVPVFNAAHTITLRYSF